MSGNVAGTIDAPLDMFGGLVTDMAPADLPPGVSPDCADVKFIQGGVQTRPGLLVPAGLSGIGGTNKINYLKTFTDLLQNFRLLYLDSVGTLWQDFPQGTETSLLSGTAISPTSLIGQSTSLFGREYIAFSDGKAGNNIPRQWDTTNLDRVSQVGPGEGPAGVVDAAAEAAKTITASGANRVSGISTITTSTPHGYAVNQIVLVAGVTDASFNGTFTIQSVPSTTTFTYGQTAADSASGNGTATLQPQIVAGTHKVVCIFVTQQNYFTAPSPPTIYTAAGGRRALVNGIPIGPANVKKRILAFTSAGGASYFYTTGMIINDNSITSLAVDFSDTTLLASTNVDALFRNIELGEVLGFIDYGNRLFAWGERNKVNNAGNLSFDGGFTSSSRPLGWSQPTAGGTNENTNVVWGQAYKMTGTGAPTVGLTGIGLFQDANGARILQDNTDYTIRVRATRDGGLTTGALRLVAQSAAGGFTAGLGINLNANSMGPPYTEYTAQLIPAQILASDLSLSLSLINNPTNAQSVYVDNIEIFPTLTPNNLSVVRASRVNDPESFDGVKGFMQVNVNDGQAVKAAFKLREWLYFVKDRSLYQTQDDGQNEPASWAVSLVSSKVGTPSVNGVDVAEEWAIIVNREGAYIFWGPEPVKISQEIQPLWDTINWQYGHTVWVRIDTQNKRILIGVPIGAATPNRVLMMDYRALGNAEEIATHSSLHYSAYTGRIIPIGNGRKWCPWFITANSAAKVERTDGTAQMFLGNGAGTGKIYQLSDTQFSDDGAAINSYYTTCFFLHHELEQALQLGSHRKLFYYLTQFVEGAGSLSVTALPPGSVNPVLLPSLTLANPARQDQEMPINIPAERLAFKVGTNAVGAWFKMQKFITSLKRDPQAPVRGLN